MTIAELRRTLGQLVWPNGTLVLIAAIAFASGLFRDLVTRGANYAAVAVIAAGLLTAWRFHAMRSIAGLLLFAAAIFAFAQTDVADMPPALASALSFLLPLNIVALLLVEEFTLSPEPIAYWFAFIAVQAGVLAVTCRPLQENAFWSWLNWHPSWWPSISLQPIAALTFVAALVALLFKFAKDRRPL